MTNFLFIKNLETKLLGFLILLFLLSAGLNAQNTVSGVVSDKDGPVPGVNVSVKGMKISTSTNMDGSYVLKSIPEKAVLVFSYISYKNKEVAVNGQKTINVFLESDVTTLSNVVVVGYGTMKRTDLTGSVASVSSEAIKNSVTTSIEQVLQGRAAGVDVQQNSGAPGAGSSIRIRGVSSITGSNEPVFVIDGVIVEGTIGSGLNSGTDNSLGSVNPLAAINPADIVSIDILKDASATAIYGSRAANGVIMVTTKRGRKGELNLTFNSSVGWQQIPKRLSVLNLREFATHKNNLANFGIVVRDNSFVRADLLGDGTNWQDEIFTKAMIQNYNLSASGGSDKTTYAMSLGYLDQTGIAIGSGFNRSNLSGNLDSQVKDYLKVGATFALSNTAQKTTFSDGALILTALRQTPNVAVRNADGSFDGPATSEFVQTNPVALVLLKDNNNTKLGIRANTYLEIAFTKALKFKTQYSLDFNFNNDYKFDPSYTFGALNNTVRSGSRTASNSKFWNWENILTYNKKLGKSNINAMLGQEMNKTTWESLYGYRAGYLTNGATDLNAGDATTAKNSNSSGAKSMSSYFGRVFYSFDDKYLLTATLRRDGSSSFAPEKRWDWFPSAALAWKVSNENFLKNNSIINNLKLRLGWGLVGNQNAPLYAYTSVYATSATNWGTGLLAKNTPNPFLGWETTSSSNLGIDLSLLNNRIEVVADVYYKATNNLILDLILPDYLGINGTGSTAPPTENIGSLENKGIEFTVNTKNIKGKDFSWNSNVVFSLNRNKVLKMNTETGVLPQKLQQGSDVTTLTRTVAGQPIGQFYGYEVIGRFEKATDFYYKNTQGVVTPTALPTGMKIAENSVWIGDYIFKDQNNDGVIDEKDQTYIGNPAPKFTYGIGNTFTYKGFELNIFLNGSYGNDVINYQRRFLENPANGSTNVLTSALGYAQLALIDPTGPNDYRNVQIIGGDPYMPRIAASSASSTSNFRYSDRIVEDGSYLRIKNISFGYNFPEKLVSKMRLSNLKLYTNLQNVYTFSKYKGYDPEVGSINQNTLLTGIDNGRYPTPFIYTFGLTANF